MFAKLLNRLVIVFFFEDTPVAFFLREENLKPVDVLSIHGLRDVNCWLINYIPNAAKLYIDKVWSWRLTWNLVSLELKTLVHPFATR